MEISGLAPPATVMTSAMLAPSTTLGVVPLPRSAGEDPASRPSTVLSASGSEGLPCGTSQRRSSSGSATVADNPTA